MKRVLTLLVLFCLVNYTVARGSGGGGGSKNVDKEYTSITGLSNDPPYDVLIMMFLIIGGLGIGCPFGIVLGIIAGVTVWALIVHVFGVVFEVFLGVYYLLRKIYHLCYPPPKILPIELMSGSQSP